MILTRLVFFFLSLLLSPAAGQLVSAGAKCSPGFEWLFTSVNQSPCDVAVELGGVCVAGEFNVSQLEPGNVYLGPTGSEADNCRCSSVYYSLLSACAFCQQHSYTTWSAYDADCSTIYVATFPEPIPLGVKVPTWAYQNVSVENIFDINIANSTNKSEGPPSSATTSSSTAISSASTSTQAGSSNKTIAAIAATVGALFGLALIGGLVAFCMVWKRKRSSRTVTRQESVLMNRNRNPEDTRLTIPGFSAPGTPFGPFGTLDPQPYYHVPDSACTSPLTSYPMSMGGTSDIYETTSLVSPNIGERYHNLQTSSVIPYHDRDPQTPLSTLHVLTDNYWTQTGSPSIAHSQPSTDRYHDLPPLSVVGMRPTGVSDPTSATTDRQSPQRNQDTLPSLDSKIRLLPPAYADIVQGMARQSPLPEKQEF